MDLEALALAVDEELRVPAAERRIGRLYAVRCGGGVGESAGGEGGAAGGGDGLALELLAEGEARELPQGVRPPAGVRALALVTGAWAAPLDDGGPGCRPSRHPQRRRAHLTVVVGADGDRDGVDVTVLRYAGGDPTVLRGGVGLVHQRLLRCWSRRPDAS